LSKNGITIGDRNPIKNQPTGTQEGFIFGTLALNAQENPKRGPREVQEGLREPKRALREAQESPRRAQEEP
jgi:hypothetical protein